jgi:HAD superfamily hydrolase (TIGR01509 family)
VSRFAFADAIRAVFFDAGNTLMWIDHARIAQILVREGVDCDEATVRVAEMRARPLLDPFVAGAARRESGETTSRYVDLIVDAIAPSATRGARDAVIAEWYTLWTRPPADAHATLSTLLRRGLRLGVVSNSNGTVCSLLDAAGLGTSLECVIDSAVVGVEKPDPRIFAMAADRLALPPSACVYIGDFHSLDVLGARGAGMHAVLMDPIGAWSGVAAAAAATRVASLTEFAARL